MISPFGLMYLRPGNLWTDFVIKRKKVKNITGRAPVSEFAESGVLSGILAEASADDTDLSQRMWDQEQHSLTHTLVIRGSADIRKGDYLISKGRTFLVLLYSDIGNLGASGIVYLEERNDLK